MGQGNTFLYHCLYNETQNPPAAPVAAAALPPEAENAPCRTGKHSGPEGRNGARNEPKNCLTSKFLYHWLYNETYET